MWVYMYQSQPNRVCVCICVCVSRVLLGYDFYFNLLRCAHVTQAGLKRPKEHTTALIFPPPPHECWEYRCVPPHLIYGRLGMKPRASSMPGKHDTN